MARKPEPGSIAEVNHFQRLRDAKDAKYKFRSYKGVKYVAPDRPAPAHFMRCGHCKRAWDDSKSTDLTPTPAGRCPFEYWHR